MQKEKQEEKERGVGEEKVIEEKVIVEKVIVEKVIVENKERTYKYACKRR